ncbi:MAG: hypothetical protein ABL955_01260 [Elusimicrobiota bacterium]
MKEEKNRFELSAQEWLGTPWIPKPVNLCLVFQVNCPGCFIMSLPQLERLRREWAPRGVGFFGLSTAFEDFELNAPKHTHALFHKRKVVGETAKALLRENIDPAALEINFPVGIDRRLPDGRGETFARHELPGTPTWLILDEERRILAGWFGHENDDDVSRRLETLSRKGD